MRFGVFLLFFPGLALAAPLGTDVETLPKVEVRASRRLKREAAQPSEFSGESLELEKESASPLPQALKRAPSVRVQQTGGEGASPVFLFRGMDPWQTRVFLEGIPLTDAEFNGGNYHFVPSTALARVDLYPEGVPAFLGEDGLGGAVQLHLDDLDGKSNVSTRVGSYGYWNLAGSASVKTNVTARGHFDYRQSSEDFSYFDNNGTPSNPNDDRIEKRRNNEFRRVSFLPRVRFYESATSKVDWFSVNTYHSMGIPGATALPIDGNLRQLYHLSAIQHVKNWSDSVDSRSQIFLRVGDDELTSQAANFLLIFPATQSTAVSVGTKSTIAFDVGGMKSELSTGMTWDRFQVKVLRDAQDRATKQRYQVPLGLSTSAKVFGVQVKPALSMHYYGYEGAALRNYLLASPRLGVAWEPFRGGRVRGAIGRYYRAPSMQELFGSPSGISPSPEVKAETADKIEAGGDVEWRRPFSEVSAIRVSYTYALARAHDLISYLPNSQFTRVAVNIGESLLQSHEVALEAQASRIPLSMRSAFNLLSTRNLSDVTYQNGKELPYRSPYRLESSLRYSAKQWSAEYGLSWNGPVYLDLSNAVRAEGVAEHGISANYSPPGFGTFGIEARNLGDALTTGASTGKFETTETIGYLGYPSPGRRVYLSWKVDF